MSENQGSSRLKIILSDFVYLIVLWSSFLIASHQSVIVQAQIKEALKLNHLVLVLLQRLVELLNARFELCACKYKTKGLKLHNISEVWSKFVFIAKWTSEDQGSIGLETILSDLFNLIVLWSSFLIASYQSVISFMFVTAIRLFFHVWC